MLFFYLILHLRISDWFLLFFSKLFALVDSEDVADTMCRNVGN